MSPCKRILGWLPAQVLGELDTARQKEVAEHVAGCPHCADELAQLEKSLRAVGQIERVPPSAARRVLAVERARTEYDRALAEAKLSGLRALAGRPWLRALVAASLLLVAGAAGIFWWKGKSASPPLVLRAYEVDGEVRLLSRATGTWEKMQAGAEIQTGEQVITSRHARATFVSDKQDRVVLNEDSHLEVGAAVGEGAQHQVTLWYGEALFEISPLPGRKWYVATPPLGTIEVRGTEFNVRYR